MDSNKCNPTIPLIKTEDFDADSVELSHPTTPSVPGVISPEHLGRVSPIGILVADRKRRGSPASSIGSHSVRFNLENDDEEKNEDRSACGQTESDIHKDDNECAPYAVTKIGDGETATLLNSEMATSPDFLSAGTRDQHRVSFDSNSFYGEEDDEDYADSVDAIMRRKYSQDKGPFSKKGRRMSRRSSSRRTSSPFLSSDAESYYRRRRRSGSTTTSGDETVVSIDEQELTEDEIMENLKLHKEVISGVKMQPWKITKKLTMLRRAKDYVQGHEGEIAQSKRSRDVFAKYKILISRFWVKFKRALGNLITSITPWEMRIKKIESHFGSVVASYFTFLRWIFWINFAITAFIVGFIMVPEILGNSEINDTMRKGVEDDEVDDALKLSAIWNFEGYLKFSPIFYGYYSNRNKNSFGYKVPMAYFLTLLCVYMYSFAVILRRMAENSRMSKMAEKDDEYTFTWKLFTGWDYMIGNSETAYNKFASINMGFKEAILDEKEKKKEKKSWKIITLRVLANLFVLILLVSSAYAVVLVVERSQRPDADSNWWRQNEVTVVVSLISTVYPSFFDIIGLMEHYHPRQQLRWQLARILILYLLNLYTLIFALFAKVSDMTDQLELLKPNATTNLMTTIAMTTNATMAPTTTPVPPTDWTTSLSKENCTLMIWPNCTEISDILSSAFSDYSFTTYTTMVEALKNYTSTTIASNANATVNSTENPLINNTIFSLFDNVTDLNSDSDITTFVSGFITSIFASAFKMKTPKKDLKVMNLMMEGYENGDIDIGEEDYNVKEFITEPPVVVPTVPPLPRMLLAEILQKCVLPLCTDSKESEELLKKYYLSRSKRNVEPDPDPGATECVGSDCFSREKLKLMITPFMAKNVTDFNITFDFETNYTIYPRNCSTNDCLSTTEIDFTTTEMITNFETTPTAPAYYSHLSENDKTQLKKLCWETMFGQELVKLTIMDLVSTLIMILLTDWFRAFFVRFGNKCCFWDMEKNFPGYGDFKIAENILHMVNNQGMIWMGMFFSPGLPAINTVKLVIMMYARSWAVLTCNIPHETVFRASRSNNFYFALLLVMLFLCTLPVGYAVVWLEPSWHCGPFSDFPKIYKILTSHLTAALPTMLNKVLDYITSPGIVIPMLLLLVLAIYYYVSIAASLREANEDLKLQLRRERNEDKKKDATSKAPLAQDDALKLEKALGLWGSVKKKPDVDSEDNEDDGEKTNLIKPPKKSKKSKKHDKEDGDVPVIKISADDSDEEKEKKVARKLWNAFKARKEKRMSSKEDSEDSGRQDSVQTESSDVDRLLSPNDALNRIEIEPEGYDNESEQHPGFEVEDGLNDEEPVYEYEEGTLPIDQANETLEEIEDYDGNAEPYQGASDEYPPFESALDNILSVEGANEAYDQQQNLSDIVEEGDDHYDQENAADDQYDETVDDAQDQEYPNYYYDEEQYNDQAELQGDEEYAYEEEYEEEPPTYQ